MSEVEKDKYTIKPLTNDCDYGLWKIRVTAALEALGLARVVTVEAASETASTADAGNRGSPTEADVEKKRKACAIIVRALSDGALRVVRDVVNDPVQMLAKLDDRYDNNSTASKISKMSELVSTVYKIPSKDIRKHIDKLAGLVAQLKAMKTNLDDTLAVGIMLASIQVPALAPVVAAIKTLADDQVTWDDVATRLIEEWREIPRATPVSQSAYTAAAGHPSYTTCDHRGRASSHYRKRAKSRKTTERAAGAKVVTSVESSAEGPTIAYRDA